MESLARQGAGEMLVGMVERVTFHNAETGFCVLRVQVRRLRRAESSQKPVATVKG